MKIMTPAAYRKFLIEDDKKFLAEQAQTILNETSRMSDFEYKILLPLATLILIMTIVALSIIY